MNGTCIEEGCGEICGAVHERTRGPDGRLGPWHYTRADRCAQHRAAPEMLAAHADLLAARDELHDTILYRGNGRGAALLCTTIDLDGAACWALGHSSPEAQRKVAKRLRAHQHALEDFARDCAPELPTFDPAVCRPLEQLELLGGAS